MFKVQGNEGGVLAVESATIDTISSVKELPKEYGDWVLTEAADMLQIPADFLETLKSIGDANPMFATFAVPGGLSRKLSVADDAANDVPSRFWPDSSVTTMVQKVRNERLPGYRGHAASEADLMSLPNPSILWVAAAEAAHKETGQKGGIYRGYVYPFDGTRELIKTGAINSVSPTAIVNSTPEMNDDGQPVEMIHESNPLSLDLVRKFSQGLRGATILAHEVATMQLTPEQRKLVSEIGIDVLKEVNPKLVSTIAEEAAKTRVSPDVTDLFNKYQALIGENAALAINSGIATEMAKALGCEVADLPSKMTEFKQIQKAQVTLAVESAVGKIDNEIIREHVKTQVASQDFKTPEDARVAVESAAANLKDFIAKSAKNYGGLTTTDGGGKTGNSVVSSEAAFLVTPGGK